MKKEFKQIILMILTVAIIASICASVIGCGGANKEKSTDPVQTRTPQT